jgi:hypothetical protein
MNNDLISRNALKEAMQTEITNVPQPDTDADYYVGVKQGLKLAETMIENAPAVFSCNTCKNMGNEQECIDCHDYSNYVHYEERPKGKWVKDEEHSITIEMFKCSICGYWNGAEHFRFCPNCGARMVGDEE